MFSTPLGPTYRWDMWGNAENRAVLIGGVALRHPAGVFVVPPQFHPSVLKPSLNLQTRKYSWWEMSSRRSIWLCMWTNIMRTIPHLLVGQPCRLCQVLHFSWSEVSLHAEALDKKINLTLCKGRPDLCFGVISIGCALFLWGLCNSAIGALTLCDCIGPWLLHERSGPIFTSVRTPTARLIKIFLRPGSWVCLRETSFFAASRTPWVCEGGSKGSISHHSVKILH